MRRLVQSRGSVPDINLMVESDDSWWWMSAWMSPRRTMLVMSPDSGLSEAESRLVRECWCVGLEARLSGLIRLSLFAWRHSLSTE